MQVPPSFGVAFWPQEENSKQLQRYSGNRLRLLCSEHNWLFADRVKSAESAFVRLEIGPVPTLSKMHDLYAATVVVPTKADLDGAIEILREAFPGLKKMSRRQGRPDEFVYDDVHVLAKLGESAPGLPDGLRDRQFEIQVRTGLQYAWWRATHDQIYKGGDRTWRLQRVASQVRASLELLDGVLADLQTAARLLDEVVTQDDKAFADVVECLNRWPEGRRPADLSRFYAGVSELVRAAEMSPADLAAWLDSDVGQALLAESEISPLQAVLGAVVAEKGPKVVNGLRPRYVLVTDELLRVCPEVGAVPTKRRAGLS